MRMVMSLAFGLFVALFGLGNTACNTTYNMAITSFVDDEAEARELYRSVALPTIQVQCPHGWGSGVVFSKGEYVLTAAHVVSYEDTDDNGIVTSKPEENPVIFKNEGMLPFITGSTVVKIDYKLDLAILKLARVYPYGFSTFSLIDPYLYQKCWVSGHPHAVTDTTITEGRVQDLWDEGFIRYSAQSTFGNSGGPVFMKVNGKYVVFSICQRVHIEGPGVATTHLGLGARPEVIRAFVDGY